MSGAMYDVHGSKVDLDMPEYMRSLSQKYQSVVNENVSSSSFLLFSLPKSQ